MSETELFRNVVPFVVAADCGSFRAAATSLGVSPAAVSKSVRALEADLGVTLVARTTRSFALTREGEHFAALARQAVAAVRGARRDVSAMRAVPAGELRVSAPFLAAPLMGPALALLRARHPGLTVRLDFTDRLSRVAEESVDVAVRVGPLADSSLIARRLRATRVVTVAAPTYLARRGPPRDLDALAGHELLVWRAPNGRPQAWWFSSGARAVDAAVLTDHSPSLVDLAVAGVGVTQALDFMVDEHLRAGHLVRVLEHLTATGPEVHAVCAPGQRASQRVRAAFAAFADSFGG